MGATTLSILHSYQSSILRGFLGRMCLEHSNNGIDPWSIRLPPTHPPPAHRRPSCTRTLRPRTRKKA